jgi:large repetitive protein
MKTRLRLLVAASSLLLAVGHPGAGSADQTLAQTAGPPVILTAGLSCTNGVCAIGPGNVGTFFNWAISESGGQGPTPFDWSVVAGALPDGLSLDGPGCGVHCARVIGTPTTVQTTTFTVQVTDSAGQTGQQAFSLQINPPRPLVVTTPSNCCSPGTVGTFYQVHFFADGGVQPWVWSLAAGQFPPGLTLDPSGLLAGTPTTAGTFTFTVQVADQSGQQATGQFSITIS